MFLVYHPPVRCLTPPLYSVKSSLKQRLAKSPLMPLLYDKTGGPHTSLKPVHTSQQFGGYRGPCAAMAVIINDSPVPAVGPE